MSTNEETEMVDTECRRIETMTEHDRLRTAARSALRALSELPERDDGGLVSQARSALIRALAEDGGSPPPADAAVTGVDDDPAASPGDLGPDAGEILIARFIVEHRDEFEAWLRVRGVSYRWSGARHWLLRQERRIACTPRLIRLLEIES